MPHQAAGDDIVQAHRFKTNLNCGSCVAAVTPLLDGEGTIERWSVDTASPEKTLTVEGEGIAPDRVEGLVAQAGFRAVEVAGEAHPVPDEPAPGTTHSLRTFYPLALIGAFLVGVVGLVDWRSGGPDPMRAMANFMAGFFLVFSFFKLLDLRAFASAYSTYDIVARKWPRYGYVYPFIELGLGVAYLVGFRPLLTNLATVVVMGVSSVGVVRSLMQRKTIRCACLGTVFNLPMTSITVVEDLLMVAMALVMLAGTSFPAAMP
jgi:Methylamine utilisation protein MauE